MGSTRIEVLDLTKAYPGTGGTPPTTAVDKVSLTIEPGELFFLLGPSGCGKTTLLRMIAGFIEPTSGIIRFEQDGNSIDITHMPAEQRETGMVFQSYALWPHMTVAQNVGFGLEMRRQQPEQRDALVKAALESVQMGAMATRRPTQLSGGQQQRVALARAMVVNPRVLLLDEPLSNLDAKLRVQLRSVIRQACKNSGMTAIYVTHDQEEALSMADRIAVMRFGKIEQIGTPREMYEQPGTAFVSRFLGEVNVLRGTIQALNQSTCTLTARCGTFDVPAAQVAAGLTVGSQAELHFRPETCRLVRSAEHSSDDFVLHGESVGQTYLGSTMSTTMKLIDGTLINISTTGRAIDNSCTHMYVHVPRDMVRVLQASAND